MDLCTSDFDFELPEECITQTAMEPRDHARLLHVVGGKLSDHHVYDLPDLLRPDDVLVMNDTKVIPARLFGKRGEVNIEILLHKKTAPSTWQAFARPGKRLKTGDRVIFAEGFEAELLEKLETGEVEIRFNVADEKLIALLHQHGEPPLPPYIHRDKGAARADTDRYQTIYAKREGAVAAPTAGLHFTPELFAHLGAKGIERLTVTLHVGAGTFLPVKTERIADHKMHSEWAELSPEVAARLNQAKKAGRRIVAVGTTSMRVLETAADDTGTIHPFSGDTSIFMYPGYRVKTVDALLTNFHLPKSTLFMLVSAFAGQKHMKDAYSYAIKNNYRFYSYGDATLLEKA